MSRAYAIGAAINWGNEACTPTFTATFSLNHILMIWHKRRSLLARGRPRPVAPRVQPDPCEGFIRTPPRLKMAPPSARWRDVDQRSMRPAEALQTGLAPPKRGNPAKGPKRNCLPARLGGGVQPAELAEINKEKNDSPAGYRWMMDSE